MNTAQNSKAFWEIIGLIPAAGTASRIAPLPCSKELYPIGFRSVSGWNEIRPKVVTHYLLEKMRQADITKVFMILRAEKWDIPRYFVDGKMFDMDIAYLMMDLSYGVPFTLDRAYPFVKNALIAIGFPDIIFEPYDAYIKIIRKQTETNADIVLGLFPTNNPHKTDMVELDENGKVRALHIILKYTQLIYTWQIAVWTPTFTDCLHNYVSDRKERDKLEHQNELYIGDVIQAALEDTIQINSVLFKDGKCLDIGTPEDLIKALQVNM